MSTSSNNKQAGGFTPGPWWNYPNESDGRMKGFIRDGKGVAVCKVNSTGREYDEYRANARLIAAVPDLLEACQSALVGQQHGLNIRGWESLKNKLVAAIAKAEGQS